MHFIRHGICLNRSYLLFLKLLKINILMQNVLGDFSCRVLGHFLSWGNLGDVRRNPRVCTSHVLTISDNPPGITSSILSIIMGKRCPETHGEIFKGWVAHGEECQRLQSSRDALLSSLHDVRAQQPWKRPHCIGKSMMFVKNHK